MRATRIILFLFFPFALLGQTRVINRSLQKQRQDSAYLYVGASNKLQIISPGKANSLLLRINGKLVPKTDSTFAYEPSKPGFDTAQVFTGNKLLATTIFKVDTISLPQAFIANTMAETMTKNRLLVNPFVSARNPDCYYEFYLSVVFFRCTIKDMDFRTPHSYLSNEMIAEIKKLHSGDSIQFDNIRVVSPGCGRAIELPDKTIKIE